MNSSNELKILVLDIVNQILAKKGKENLSSFNGDLRLREDLELDSLDLAELTVRIENKTGVDIFEKGLIYTLGDVVKRIEEEKGV